VPNATKNPRGGRDRGPTIEFGKVVVQLGLCGVPIWSVLGSK
jgi:hypothetical protein